MQRSNSFKRLSRIGRPVISGLDIERVDTEIDLVETNSFSVRLLFSTTPPLTHTHTHMRTLRTLLFVFYRTCDFKQRKCPLFTAIYQYAAAMTSVRSFSLRIRKVCCIVVLLNVKFTAQAVNSYYIYLHGVPTPQRAVVLLFCFV
jgi:hypothetical protein